MILGLLFMLFAALQLLDIITTNRALAAGGREANPIVRWFMGRLGQRWWLSKAIPLGAVLPWLWISPGGAIIVLLAGNLLYLWVVWNNWQMLSLDKRPSL